MQGITPIGQAPRLAGRALPIEPGTAAKEFAAAGSSEVTPEFGGARRAHGVAKILRHEIIARLMHRFEGLLRSTSASLNPYRDLSDPGEAAADLVGIARTLAEASDDAPRDTLGTVRRAVSDAAAETRKQVDDSRELLDATEQRIHKTLDVLDSDERLMRATALSVEAMSKQRSVIRIRTQEGDVVRLDLRQIERMSVEGVSVRADGVELAATGIEVSSGSRLKLVIEGHLSDAEFEAIRDVYAKAESLAAEFFDGDMRAALEIAAGLEYDSAQLARVSMRFKSVERMSTTIAALQSSPQIAASVAADADAAASTVATTAGAAAAVPLTPNASDVPVASEVEPAKPEVAAVPLAEQAPPYGEGFLAGFSAFVDYLSQLADYLEDTTARLSEFAGRFEPDAGLQLEFTQTTQLEILRSVMTVYQPVGEIVAPEEPGDRIAQLDAIVDDAYDD